MAVRWIQTPLPPWELKTGTDFSNVRYNLRRYVTNNLAEGDLHFEAELAAPPPGQDIANYLHLTSSSGMVRFPDTLAAQIDLPTNINPSNVLPISVYDLGVGERPYDSVAHTTLPIFVRAPLRITDPEDVGNDQIRVGATGGLGGYRWRLRANAPNRPVPAVVYFVEQQAEYCIIQKPASVPPDSDSHFVIGVSTPNNPDENYQGEEDVFLIPLS